MAYIYGDIGGFDPAKSTMAMTLCDPAAELADYRDSNIDRAWVAPHRGVVSEFARQDAAAAFPALDTALKEFLREESEEGEFVTRIHRGRVLLTLGQGREAAAEFERAMRLWNIVTDADTADFHYVTAVHISLWIEHQKTLARLRDLSDEGKPAEAIEAARQMNRLSTACSAPTHLYSVLTLTVMAELTAENGDMDAAKEYIQMAGTLVARLYTPEHERAVTVRVKDAWVRQLAGLTDLERQKYWAAEADTRRAAVLTRQRQDAERLSCS